LGATAAFWGPIRRAFAWVHEATHLLGNQGDHRVEEVRRDYRALLGEMSRERESVSPLASAVAHFWKVTKSHWLGLFRCYEVAGLPATNNDLERTFRATRYHERRASGRRTASPGLVVRGAVRVIAAVASRGKPLTAAELRPTDLGRWREMRAELAVRHETRRCQSRFRRAPDSYLAHLEASLLQLRLPP
jgi:Transposase IS66 family